MIPAPRLRPEAAARMSPSHAGHGSPQSLRVSLGLAVAAVGVVFGDIGTSPLYALKESFHHLVGAEGETVDRFELLGVLSIVFWSMTLVVSVKYLLFILRANNRGEGGIFALLSLIPRGLKTGGSRMHLAAMVMALLGAGLLFGDGIITPSISVLSAMEGLKIVNPNFEQAVLPLTLVVLVALFSMQSLGTGRIGALFGPIMILWFLCLAALGVRGILMDPSVISALNPYWIGYLFWQEPFEAFVLLGALVLVITGAEAMYADLGHFGIFPIRLSWYGFVAPALFLNYLGQGAMLLQNPEAVTNPFYELVPSSLRLPMVVLATLATVIASQALISGMFSLTQQCMRLGYMPRIRIVHTSDEHRGQIYVPLVNWMLLVGCLITVALFRSSSGLAGAYGIAVCLDMTITTLMFAIVARRLWRWRRRWIMVVVAVFLAVDVAYLGSNALKIPSGGWFTLVIAGGVFVVLSTWVRGRWLSGRRIADETTTIHDFLGGLWARDIPRVPGTAVFLTTSYNAPHALVKFVEHAHVLHRQVVLLSIVPVNAPIVPLKRGVTVEWLPDGLWRVSAKCGFMQSPNVPAILEEARKGGLEFTMADTTFFSVRLEVTTDGPSPMPRWQKALYAALTRNATDANDAFGIPPERVVNFGSRLAL
jgi:KUP system potassium uptake protein